MSGTTFFFLLAERPHEFEPGEHMLCHDLRLEGEKFYQLDIRDLFFLFFILALRATRFTYGLTYFCSLVLLGF